MEELTGQTFAGYEIVAKLGEGGMGAVYKAKQPVLNRFVALKTMAAHLSGDKEFVARFQREAASAATLDHSNVVRVHTAGEADGVHYIVMEFVDGESVRKRLDRDGRIPPAEALAITIYVAQALQYAWNEAKLIHRDIKPDNIFISKKGEVKVGDLGLAKSLATEGTEMTATGMAMGSPHYISPEQATGIRDIDFRTDIYSLGCSLYHMLTGQTPYKGDSSMIVMMKHVNDPPPAIFKAWPQCPMPLGMLVGRMLAKDRNARPKSYEQLVADLFAVSEKLQQPATPAPAPAPVATSKPTVVEKAAAPALAPATSPDAPTVALQSSTKPKSFVAIYAAAGVAALLALGGLFLWSPWGKPSAQDSNTPSLQQSSSSESPWTDGLAEWWANPKNATSGVLVKETGGSRKLAPIDSVWFAKGRDIAIRATVTGQKWSSWFVGLRNGPKGNYSAHLTSPGRPSSLTVTVDGKSKELQEFSIPPGFRIELSHVMEFRVQGDLLTVALDGTEVARVRDSSLPDAGNVFLAGPSGTLIEKFEYRDLSAAARTVDDAFVREVAALPAEQQVKRVMEKLVELNPKFNKAEARERHEIENGTVTLLVFSACNITDISPVRALTNLRKLGCGGMAGKYSPLADLSPLRGLKLTKLIVYGTHVRDLSPLKDMPLTALELGHTAIEDLSPLQGLALTELQVQQTRVRDLTPLRGMPLEDFRCYHNKDISDLSPLQGARLKVLVCFNTSARDLSLLKGATLTDLRCDPAAAATPSNRQILTAIKTLKKINDLSSAEFWKQVDAGKLPKARLALADPTEEADGTPDAGWQNAINLLPLIDPQKDAVEGGWSLRNGELVSGDGNYNRIEIPYRPPAEYDFQIEFSTRATKQTGPVQLLSKAGRQFRWQCFCRPRSSFGFEAVGGTTIHESPAKVELPITLRNDRRYVSLVQVRNGVVRGFFDGKLCVEWKTDYADMDIPDKWKLRAADVLGIGSQIPITFHRIEVREVTGKGTFTRGASADADAGWQNAINLLPLIDPQKDAVAGQWSMSNGELMVSQGQAYARIELPYCPPPDYDFRIEFTRETGIGAIWQMLACKDHSFNWCIAGGMGETVGRWFGFEAEGRTMETSPASVLMEQNIENGRRYVSELKVRTEGVQAFFNGRLVTEWKNNYGGTRISRVLALRDERLLGVGAHFSKTTFHRIEVREVTGKGTFTRGAPAVSNAPPVITNWKDAMPFVRAEMDKTGAVRHEAGWSVHTQTRTSGINICDRQMGDVAVRGRFRNNIEIGLAACGPPSRSYLFKLKRGGGTLQLRRYVDNTHIEDQPLAILRHPSADEHDFLITKVGDLLSAWVDGSLAGSARDSTLTSGTVRMCFLYSDDAIRDLAIADLSAGAPATTDAGWQNAINLLPLIEPQKDAVVGSWRKENDALTVEPLVDARLQIPYRPPAEYDFRIEFTALSGDREVAQVLSANARSFLWKMGAYRSPSVFTFQVVKSKAAYSTRPDQPQPPGSVRTGNFYLPVAVVGSLEKERRYCSTVRVRKDGVSAVVDGQVVLEHKTDYSDMSMQSGMELGDPATLGIAARISRVTFHRIEVREVTGKGTFTRGASAGASNAPTLQHSTTPAALSAFVREVAALPAEEQVKRVVAKLKELNPGFDGTVDHRIKKGVVTDLNFSTVAVVDISPVRALTGLKKLMCEGERTPSGSEKRKGLLADLSPLRGLKLEDLSCSRNKISDLAPLKGMPLTSFECKNTDITNLEPLAGMPLLSLRIAANRIDDLTPLKGMPLQNLLCGEQQVKDLSPLAGLPLVGLDINGTQVHDLSPLRGMQLERAWLERTMVNDLSPLAGMPLKSLKIDRPVRDLSPLRGMPLQQLVCVFVPQRDTELLRSITTLKTINNLPAVEFWKKVEAGEVPQAK